ncbi:Intraflagellar transport protein IFT81 [Giardia muris]|uniref:Intraflagellar transport protein IFT81 n=1 Tax=Giardia muris TaxID=5742 RepID=A0A4Z1SRF1_GIAMU|nr:Intraflagellar transport protein IFT81 [Giardia muris]|eukprot:TNJ28484.1 Intraflagellar transport protein IFT81 [Giardia muris]
MTTDQLQVIVDGLNAPPFERRVTLISVSEQLHDPVAAIQLLADVSYQVRPIPLAEEQPVMTPIKVTSANLEQAAGTLLDFTLCLIDGGETRSVPDRQAFQQAMLLPDSVELRSLLCAALKDLPAAKETIYVMKYRAPPPIPTTYISDSQIQSLLSQLREAQSRFSEALNQNREKQQQMVSQRLERLATDKTTYIARRDKLFDRVKHAKTLNVPDEAVRLANRRRISLSEVEDLRVQVQNQNDIRRATLQAAQAVVNSARGTPASILEATEAEHVRLTQEVASLPIEIAEKESLTQCIRSEPGQETIDVMESELEMLRTDLAKYRELVQGVDDGGGDDDGDASRQEQTVFLRQQLVKLRNQRTALEARLAKAHQESEQLNAELLQRCHDVDLSSLVAGLDTLEYIPTLLFKDLLAKGKSLKPLHKRAVDEQQTLRRESAIISRTRDILAAIPDLLDGEEDDRAGPADRSLLNVRNAGEARAVLSEVTATIEVKRREYASRSSQLATQRRLIQQLEAELETERQRSQALEASREGVVYKLHQAVRAEEAEQEDLISRAMCAERNAEALRYELDRAENAREFERLKRETLAELNTSTTEIVEARAAQQNLRNELPNRMAQRAMFRDLCELLAFRKRLAEERRADRDAEQKLGANRLTNAL